MQNINLHDCVLAYMYFIFYMSVWVCVLRGVYSSSPSVYKIHIHKKSTLNCSNSHMIHTWCLWTITRPHTHKQRTTGRQVTHTHTHVCT